MKAFLLAAGYGTRLKPLTDITPKCLVPVKGVPMLGWWFKLFKENKVNEVLVNTHYLSDQVEAYIEEYNRKYSFNATSFYEKELLGSGGTIKVNKHFIEKDECFFICYADNLTDINLLKMYEFHKKNDTLLTMGLFRTDRPKQCGIVKLGKNNRIIEFEEKPKEPMGNLANAGVYIAKRSIFKYFPNKEIIDFSKDVLPLLVGKMCGYEIEEYLIDIGSLDNYKKAEKEWNYDYYEDTF